MIAAELAEMGLTPPPETEAVVRRVIHTTADFDYAKNLRFTPGAVQKAVEALHKGAFLVTDTNMALAGITKPGLAKLGGQAACYMADPEVAARAKAEGTTRAVAAMHKAAAEHPGAILAVGNAPTALLTIAEQIEAGLRPALVIGVPVGFVNVVESKACLPLWQWAARAAAMWPPPSATPSFILPRRCWTPRPGAGTVEDF